MVYIEWSSRHAPDLRAKRELEGNQKQWNFPVDVLRKKGELGGRGGLGQSCMASCACKELSKEFRDCVDVLSYSWSGICLRRITRQYLFFYTQKCSEIMTWGSLGLAPQRVCCIFQKYTFTLQNLNSTVLFLSIWNVWDCFKKIYDGDIQHGENRGWSGSLLSIGGIVTVLSARPVKPTPA